MKKHTTIIAILLALVTAITASVSFLWLKHRKPELELVSATWEELPGWHEADLRAPLAALKRSCVVLLHDNPDKNIGSSLVKLTARNWYGPCHTLMQMYNPSATEARNFFEQWFTPAKFITGQQVEGLFTAYYLPEFNGSLVKTDQYNIPLYDRPPDLIEVDLHAFDEDLHSNRKIIGRVQGHKLIPYYTRAAINSGAIAKTTKVIAWLDSRLSRQFLEIEGSGIVRLPNGEKLFVGYNGQNGRKYLSMQKILIDRGILTPDTASEDNVRKYFTEHPEMLEELTSKNESFVFFRRESGIAATGIRNTLLTPGISLAVDRKYIPYGIPLWLDTVLPTANPQQNQLWRKMMLAQDTGGAIRGPVRGDIFLGSGDEAMSIANRTRAAGFYWLLLPKDAIISR